MVLFYHWSLIRCLISGNERRDKKKVQRKLDKKLKKKFQDIFINSISICILISARLQTPST